ncbi:TPA: glucosyltransferase domain-containing protein, partial [Salmonella enterica]|nr:glucosyltransferase domain-containing protein [Salmonella enterica]
MKQIKTYFIIILLLVAPIILANIYYIDDIGRSTLGYRSWWEDGRPLSDIFMSVLMFSGTMVDISPVPLLVACAMLSWVFYRFSNEFFNNKKELFLLPLSFLINPFIVEVLSYRFDSLTILLSAVLSFVFLFTLSKNYYIDILVKAILVVGVMCLYQASVNIILIFISLLFFYDIYKLKSPLEIIKLSFSRILSVLLGLVIYMKVILPLTLKSEHSDNHPRISVDLFNTVVGNLTSYYSHIEGVILPNGMGKFILPGFIIISFLSALVVSFRYFKNYKKKLGLLVFVISLLIVLVTPIATIGSLLPLDNPIIGFSRLYMGIGAYFLFVIFLATLACKESKFPSLVVLPLYTYMIVFTCAYANSSKHQFSVDKQIISSIKEDTKEFDYNTNYIIFNGEPPRSSILVNSSKNFPLLNSLVVSYFGNWTWAYYYMGFNGLKQMDPGYNSKIVNSSLKNFCNYKLLTSNQDYKLYHEGMNIVVDFSRKDCI